MIPYYPDYEELLAACAEYVRREQGDTNYEVAVGWISLYWGDAQKAAGGVRVVEETWNFDFYTRWRRIFDMARLTTAINDHMGELTYLRSRHVESFGQADEDLVRTLWDSLFAALSAIGRTERPSVATGKALHVLAPPFFVPIDNEIASAYRCNGSQPEGYISFQHSMADVANHVLDSCVLRYGGDRQGARATICGSLYPERTGSSYVKPLAKLLDEYNWVRYRSSKKRPNTA